jgi:hypothetical protein
MSKIILFQGLTMQLPDTRKQFTESWLKEFPERIAGTELIDMLRYNINDMIKNNAKVEELSNNLKKIETSSTIYYWYGDNKNPTLAIELSKSADSLIVNAVGKLNKSGPPYASDLYHAILVDQKKSNKSIQLFSDQVMTDSGLQIWKNLLKRGHKISVYNTNFPGQSFKTIDTEQELLNFFKDDDTDYREYRFVLSENTDILLNTKSLFLTRRLRELSGM